MWLIINLKIIEKTMIKFTIFKNKEKFNNKDYKIFNKSILIKIIYI